MLNLPQSALAVAVLAQFATFARADVTLQPDSITPYVPNLAGNTVFGILYTLISLILFYHVFFTGSKVDKWALVLPIGSSFEALGFWLRIALRTNQSSQPIYIVMYLFIVLSPAAFLAFNYILFGRFIAALEGHKPSQVEKKSKYSFIPPKKVKAIFVTSDIITFLIQGAGGGLQTSQMINTIKIGNDIFLTGTALQTFSYVLFTLLTIVAHRRINAEDKAQYGLTNLNETVVQLIYLLYISSVGILVRSSYRIAEFAEGYGGYLNSTELFTFVLDGLPLVIAIGVWAIVWPGLLIRKIREEAPAHKHESETLNGEQQQVMSEVDPSAA